MDVRDVFNGRRTGGRARQRASTDAADGVARVAALQMHYRLSNLPRRVCQVSILVYLNIATAFHICLAVMFQN